MSREFAVTELDKALSELGWGLESWELLAPAMCGPADARAKLNLLEHGEMIIAAVSEQGWRIALRSVVDIDRFLSDDQSKEDDQTFETLDHLLSYVSPKFENRRIKLLTESLENISVRRSWNEDEGLEEAPATTTEAESK